MDAPNRFLKILSRGVEASIRCCHGASLLYLVGAIAAVGAVGVGVAQFFPRALQTKITEERSMRAYYLALSGQNFWPTVQSGLIDNTVYTYPVGNDKILLTQVVDASGNYTVSSQGVCDANTEFEANYRMVFANRSVDNPITLNDGFSTVHPENMNYAITVFDKNQSSTPTGYNASIWASDYAANKDKYNGETWLRMAKDQTNSNGAIWYTGNYGTCASTPCPDGTCKGGQCGLGKGLRAVFSFVFNDTDTWDNSMQQADVMTFAIMSALTGNETAKACGGPADSLSIGEYLGYAGMGPYNVGIKPPKIGIEVDTYPNGCGDLYDKSPKNTPSKWTPLSSSRCDHSNANHIAAVFWGSYSSPGTSPDPKFADDNTHGAGAGSTSEPLNPGYGTISTTNASGTGYYEVPKTGTYNWLEDAQKHTMRIEIQRTTATNGTGTYIIKAWIVDGVPASTDAFQNVKVDYTAITPLINYTVTLSSTNNTNLGQIYFGWTEGTGAATQNADIYGFKLYFRK